MELKKKRGRGMLSVCPLLILPLAAICSSSLWLKFMIVPVPRRGETTSGRRPTATAGPRIIYSRIMYWWRHGLLTFRREKSVDLSLFRCYSGRRDAKERFSGECMPSVRHLPWQISSEREMNVLAVRLFALVYPQALNRMGRADGVRTPGSRRFYGVRRTSDCQLGAAGCS